MNSVCCRPPAFLTVRTAFLMCWPVAQALNRSGDAFDCLCVKLMSWKLAFPAPPPPPGADPVWVTPHENDKTSTSPLWASSALSPSIPSIFRNASNAIGDLLRLEGQDDLGRAVAAVLAQALRRLIRARGSG